MRVSPHDLVKYFAVEVAFLSDAVLRWRIRRLWELGKAKGFLPRQLAIETIAYCNAECIMCPYSGMKRRKGIMSRHVHRRIVDKVAEWGAPISLITHAGIGEPLLDKTLEEKIRYEKEAFRNARVTVFTNASLLDEMRSDSLISAGLDEVSISLHGFWKKTYESVMKLPYERTQRNISRFLEINRQAGSPINVQVCFVPNELHSTEEIREFRRYWTGKVNGIVIPPWISWGGFFPHYNKRKQWPCRYIWEVFQIDWDGTVKMCCEDYDTRYPLSNHKNQSLMEVYNSPRMQKQRMNQVHGNFLWPEICRNCIETHDVARQFWKRANLAPIH
jgi:MoaA/NifB/PqqE/SkfB family radical SAM enzyme